MSIASTAVIIRLQHLPWAAGAADVRQFFGDLQIPDGGVHIVGGQDGDAFIAFASDDDACRAMESNGGKIKDVRVKVMLSSRKQMQNVIEQARSQFTQLQQQTTTIVRKRSRSKSPNDDNDSQRSGTRDSSVSRDVTPPTQPTFDFNTQFGVSNYGKMTNSVQPTDTDDFSRYGGAPEVESFQRRSPPVQKPFGHNFSPPNDIFNQRQRDDHSGDLKPVLNNYADTSYSNQKDPSHYNNDMVPKKTISQDDALPGEFDRGGFSSRTPTKIDPRLNGNDRQMGDNVQIGNNRAFSQWDGRPIVSQQRVMVAGREPPGDYSHYLGDTPKQRSPQLERPPFHNFQKPTLEVSYGRPLASDSNIPDRIYESKPAQQPVHIQHTPPVLRSRRTLLTPSDQAQFLSNAMAQNQNNDTAHSFTQADKLALGVINVPPRAPAIGLLVGNPPAAMSQEQPVVRREPRSSLLGGPFTSPIQEQERVMRNEPPPVRSEGYMRVDQNRRSLLSTPFEDSEPLNDRDTRLKSDMMIMSSCIKISGLPEANFRYSSVRDIFQNTRILLQDCVIKLIWTPDRQRSGTALVLFGSPQDAHEALKFDQYRGLRMEPIANAEFHAAADGPVRENRRPSHDDNSHMPLGECRSWGGAAPPAPMSLATLMDLNIEPFDSTRTNDIKTGSSNGGNESPKTALLPYPPAVPLRPPPNAPWARRTDSPFVKQSLDNADEKFGLHDTTTRDPRRPPILSQPPSSASISLFEPKREMSADDIAHVVKLENVAYRLSEADIERFFKRANLVKIVIEHQWSKPTGRVFLQCMRPIDVDEMLKYDTHMLAGRQIRVRVSTPLEMKKGTSEEPKSAAEISEKLKMTREQELPVSASPPPPTAPMPPVDRNERNRSGNSRPSMENRDRGRFEGRRRSRSPLNKVAERPSRHVDNENSFYVTVQNLPYKPFITDVTALFPDFEMKPDGIILDRGCAYIEFSSSSDATKALEFDGDRFQSKRLRITRLRKSEFQRRKRDFVSRTIEEKHEPVKAKPAPEPLNSVQKQAERILDDEDPDVLPNVLPDDPIPEIDPAVIQSIGGDANCIIGVHNMSPSITLEEIVKFLEPFRVDEDSVRMYYAESGEPSGNCVLSVASPEEAQCAILQKNATVFGTNVVHVFPVNYRPTD